MDKYKLNLKCKFIKPFFIILLHIFVVEKSYSEQLKTKNSFLTANSITYHEDISLISADGDVEVINGIQVLKANKLQIAKAL